MHADVQLSTKFLTTQNAHQVGMLVTVGAEAPPRRPPINVALVLDRSGSMSGEPIEAWRTITPPGSAYMVNQVISSPRRLRDLVRARQDGDWDQAARNRSNRSAR